MNAKMRRAALYAVGAVTVAAAVTGGVYGGDNAYLIMHAVKAFCVGAAGLFTALLCFGRKKVLFLQIVFGALECMFVGAVFSALHYWMRGNDGSTHLIGSLAAVGFYFFLYSADYGALDSLADDRSAALRPKRVIAAVAAVAVTAMSLLAVLMNKNAGGAGITVGIIRAVPMTLLTYYTVKHLLLPDIDVGFVRALRPYNAAVLGFILLGIASAYLSLFGLSDILRYIAPLEGLLALLLVSLAERGVEKWYC